MWQDSVRATQHAKAPVCALRNAALANEVHLRKKYPTRIRARVPITAL
jgi:hypothetical protein